MSTLLFDLDLSNPAIWLAASVSACILGANAAWLVARAAAPGLPRPEGLLPALGWLAVSLFLLVPPLLALRSGAVSPHSLGLSELDWVEATAAGIPLAAISAAILIAGSARYARAATLGPMNQPAGFERFGHAVRAMVDAALSQWHWAFYRSTFVALLPILSATAGSASCPVLERIFEQPFYWGCWLGMAAAALEWSLNPYARAALHGPGRQSAEIRSLVLAVATTAIFSATRNFWVCVGCHAVTEAALTFWFPPVSEPAAA